MAINKIKIGSTEHELQTTIENVDGLRTALDGIDAKLNYTNIAYGTCSTAAATAAKVITLSNNAPWSLKSGAIVMVKFDNSNSASNVTINVNGTGAYPIWYNNAEYTSTGTAYTGYANRVIVYMFNGTHWVWITSSYDSNTTYTNVKLGHGYATCSTAAATAAKTATLSSYTLTTGGIVAVQFTNAVPKSATLNINSKGAKAIYYRGAAITGDIIKAGDVATFIYNGSKYILLSIDRWQKDISDLQNDLEDATTNVQIQLDAITSDLIAITIPEIDSICLIPMDPGLYQNGQLVIDWDDLVNDGSHAFVGNEVFYIDPNDTILFSMTTEGGDIDILHNVMLGDLVIPDGVTTIGYGCFQDCTNLTSISIPKGLNSIQPMAFKGCSSLKQIQGVKNISQLQGECFRDCINLTDFPIENIKSFGDNGGFCFSNTGFESVAIGQLGQYDTGMFYKCTKLKTATILDGCTEIVETTFKNCTALTDVFIAEGVTTIWGDAFAGCTSLQTITLPSTVRTIEADAFKDCTSLTTLKFNGLSTTWENNMTTLWLGKNYWAENTPFTQIICTDRTIAIS